MSAVLAAPVEFMESVSSLRLPPKADKRLQELMDRNSDGTITKDELEQLEALVELSETIGILRGQAMVLLRRKP
jgi:hypothetical protein